MPLETEGLTHTSWKRHSACLRISFQFWKGSATGLSLMRVRLILFFEEHLCFLVTLKGQSLTAPKMSVVIQYWPFMHCIAFFLFLPLLFIKV